MCLQQRFKLVCTSVQSNLRINFPSKETLDHWLPHRHALIQRREGAGGPDPPEKLKKYRVF